MANTLEGVTLPVNFVAGQAAYNGAAVPAALDEQRGISLLYLLDEQNAGSFYVLNAAGDGVYPYVQMTSGGTYTILQKADSVSAPEGYAETTLSIGEQTVAAWQLEGQTAPDFYLVYAMNASGTKGWYTYDAAEGTMQRYVCLLYTSGSDKGCQLDSDKDLPARGAAAALCAYLSGSCHAHDLGP